MQIDLTKEDVTEVSKQVALLTTHTEAISADDISLVSEITSEIADQADGSVEVHCLL